ncbi:MAG: MBL fold metallo-hydrolase [Bryobacteraceae bacterium]
MTGHIKAETLRAWLEEGRPVQIIDVRNGEDRAQWSIPGSLHIDAYAALSAGQPSVLAQAALPVDCPIVTVCNRGVMSERAAEEISARGLAVLSLTGGMKAWSLAWNIAEHSLKNARVIQVRRTGKGCLSYLIISGGEAVVIDASLPAEVYLALAGRHGARIRQVVETHIHADHLSRSRNLAGKSGAELLLPAQDRVRFPYNPIVDGAICQFGSARLKAIATPGHTMESMCYFLDGEALFTGDTLFISGVGRPDLHADPEQARDRAAVLYRSIQRLLTLPSTALVFPGHMSVPAEFDGVPISATLGGIAGGLHRWMDSETEFVDHVMARIPTAPPNYERIVELNEQGQPPEGDPTDLEAGANRCAVL